MSDPKKPSAEALRADVIQQLRTAGYTAVAANVIAAIDTAVEEERERCAKLAEVASDHWEKSDTGMARAGAAVGGQIIADRIRLRPPVIRVPRPKTSSNATCADERAGVEAKTGEAVVPRDAGGRVVVGRRRGAKRYLVSWSSTRVTPIPPPAGSPPAPRAASSG
jgi:hypothetical protein